MPSAKKKKKRLKHAQDVCKEGGPVLMTGKADHWHQDLRLRKDGKGSWGVLIVEGGATSDKELANAVPIGLRLLDNKKYKHYILLCI